MIYIDAVAFAQWLLRTFYVKTEIKYARIFEMLTVSLGESTMSRTQV